MSDLDRIGAAGRAGAAAGESLRRTALVLTRASAAAVLAARENRRLWLLSALQRLSGLSQEEVQQRAQGHTLEYLHDRLLAGYGWPGDLEWEQVSDPVMSRPKACQGCQYWHGGTFLICAVHPGGPNGETCRDWQS